MTIKPYLTLVRIPSVFTSMSNVFAGYLLAGGGLFHFDLIRGLLAGGLFIMAGMTLNDIADKKVDKEERPNRPIPSGAVPISHAWILSLSFLLLGFFLVGTASVETGVATGLLYFFLFAYNFKYKNTKYGIFFMGACRVFNLGVGYFLGQSTLLEKGTFGFSQIWMFLSLFTYISLITFIAKDEVAGNSKEKVKIFLVGLVSWTILWMVFLIENSSVIGVGLLVAFSLYLFEKLKALHEDPSAKHTGKVVMTLLLLIPLTDSLGLLLNDVSLFPALSCLGFIGLTKYVAKKFYMT